MKTYLRIHVNDSLLRSRSDTGMAEAIAEAIEQEIGREREPDHPFTANVLPPAESLALQLGITRDIVLSAYRALESRSIVRREGNGGWTTTNRKTGPSKALTPPAPALKSVLPANRPARGTPGHITLSSAFIDPRLIPTEDITHCMEAALKKPGPPTYAHVQGYPPLRELIATRLKHIGIEADPEHILITIGSQQVLDLVCRSLEVKRVATENPAYIAAKALFQMSDVAVTGLPVDPFAGIDLARWRDALAHGRPALAYLTSNFQNPTGYSYSSREMQQILEWAQEFQFGILEDDWGSDMLPYSEVKPTLRTLGGDNVLYMNAFTKKTLPSLRVGFVVCNERTLPSLRQSKKLSINGFPAMIEETLFEFIERGYYDRYLERVQSELQARYVHCLALLRTLLPDAVRWTTPGGGPVLWLEFPQRVSIERLIDDLTERKVLVNPQDRAFLTAPHLHGFMIGYAFPDRSEMTTAIEIMAELVKRQL